MLIFMLSIQPMYLLIDGSENYIKLYRSLPIPYNWILIKFFTKRALLIFCILWKGCITTLKHITKFHYRSHIDTIRGLPYSMYSYMTIGSMCQVFSVSSTELLNSHLWHVFHTYVINNFSFPNLTASWSLWQWHTLILSINAFTPYSFKV